jgi:hypothetical protein
MAVLGKSVVWREPADGVRKYGEIVVGDMAQKAAGPRDKALSGDMVITVTPAVAAPEPITGAWSQTVTVRLLTAAGEPHDWCNMTVATAATAGDTSALGTASLASRNVVFVNGVATLTLEGSAHAWTDTETATCAVDLGTNVLGYTIAAVTGTVTFTA